MSVVVAPPVLASDWDSLSVPEGYRAEIIRGELVVTPAVSVDHGRVQSHYLEIDLMAPGPVATRYELRDGVLVPTGIASGPTLLQAPRPFAYEFAPSALLD